jgi:hypothetical protein
VRALPSAFQEIGDIQVSICVSNRSQARARSFPFMQDHFWGIGESIPAQDVEGWLVGLKERLGIVATPVQTIFLVRFGNRFLCADESAMQL